MCIFMQTTHSCDTSFNPADPDSAVHARTRMEACIAEMKTWMICNKLQLNDDKSEFINYCITSSDV